MKLVIINLTKKFKNKIISYKNGDTK